jgi:hypothetical protein
MTRPIFVKMKSTLSVQDVQVAVAANRDADNPADQAVVDHKDAVALKL